MSQSNTVLGAIVFGFIVFITVKGELPAYLAILGIGSAAPAPAPAQTPAQTPSPFGGGDFGGGGANSTY